MERKQDGCACHRRRARALPTHCATIPTRVVGVRLKLLYFGVVQHCDIYILIMQYGTRGWVGKHTSLPSCSSSTCARLALASAISEELTRGGADCVTNVPRCARCSPACRACIVVPWWKEDLSDVDSVRSNSWFPPLARRQHRMRADQLSWDRYRRAPVEGEREAHKAAHVVHGTIALRARWIGMIEPKKIQCPRECGVCANMLTAGRRTSSLGPAALAYARSTRCAALCTHVHSIATWSCEKTTAHDRQSRRCLRIIGACM
jgi:hypothetical protein